MATNDERAAALAASLKPLTWSVNVWDVRAPTVIANALTAALHAAQAEAREWQPLATAPEEHDGLLLTDGVRVCQGGWLSQEDQGADYEGQCGAPYAGWWSVDCIEPTHWMPLPSPPSLEAQDVTTAERAVEPSDPGLSFSDVQRIQAEALEDVIREVVAKRNADGVDLLTTGWLRSRASALREGATKEKDKKGRYLVNTGMGKSTDPPSTSED